jgi:hypothetical protein
MTLYHEIDRDSLDSVLTDGLKRTSRGEKGDNDAIKKTDAYLDARRPATLVQKNVSRDDNIYAFLGTDKTVIDITSGIVLCLSDRKIPDTALLRLSAEQNACYVSDLDRYDAVKYAIENDMTEQLDTLAAHYWQAVVPLDTYATGTIIRPEVMITRDIRPSEIEQVT